jgi:hypothetical protein
MTLRWFTEDATDIVGGIVLVPDNVGRIRLGFGYWNLEFNCHNFAESIPNEELHQASSVNTACLFYSSKVANDPRVKFQVLETKLPDGSTFKYSEDHGWCYNAIHAGYDIFIDTRVRCKHLRYSPGDKRLIVLDAAKFKSQPNLNKESSSMNPFTWRKHNGLSKMWKP